MAEILGKLPKTYGGESSTRSQRFNATKTLSGAEWEAFYGGYWRDVSDDFRWDTTKAGNTILRAIRWDNGEFRSYREDRGLILRKKGTDDEETAKALQGIDYESFLMNIPKAFATSVATGLVLKVVPELKIPFLVGSVVAFGFSAVDVLTNQEDKRSMASKALDLAGSMIGSTLGGKALTSMIGPGAINTPFKAAVSVIKESRTPDLIVLASRQASAVTKTEPTYMGLSKEQLLKSKEGFMGQRNAAAAWSVRPTGESEKSVIGSPLNVEKKIKYASKRLRSLSVLGDTPERAPTNIRNLFIGE